MGEKSNIEWTNATWNPVTGCSKVSPGCAHCYAEALSLRRGWSALPWTPANAAANVVLHPERLVLPLRWKTPRRIFVNSMSDLFHELVPDSFVDRVFAVMALSPQHTYQVLTKRPDRMRAYMQRMAPPDYSVGDDDGVIDAMQQMEPSPWRRLRGRTVDLDFDEDGGLDDVRLLWPLPNVWLGTSVENQHWADARIPLLLHTPAAVRFLSCEPLLGPLDLSRYLTCCPSCGRPRPDRHADSCGYCEGEPTWGLAWIIAGGESGPGARPMDLAWVRALRDQAQAAGVAFFYKQKGGSRPGTDRLLDGRTWEEMPNTDGGRRDAD